MTNPSDLPNYRRIWLQPFAGDEGSHTWCQDRQSDEDIEYVRADTIDRLTSTGEAVLSDEVLVRSLEGAVQLCANANRDTYPEHDASRLSFRREILRRLKTAHPASASPREGHVEVPVEPTHEMSLAGFYNAQKTEVRDLPLYDKCVSIYRAMLAALPHNQGETKP